MTIKKYIKYACSVLTVIAIVVVNYADEIRTTQRGMEIIGNAEGCYTKPYQCPADVLTVGIGTTNAVEKIDRNKIYTLEEIAYLFKEGVKQAEKCVNEHANGKQLPQGAFEALTSITFNVGCGKMQKSTLFRMAKQGYTPQMCDQFSRWVYAGGQKMRGLEIRREKERQLCLTP
ncbi:TPA: lysozyme [Pasteurella multocida]|uniref:lysozyme n=1 Tax=Pasteurella multocida TaxID=747 RepID=UPI00202183FC|nr:lysozyme [Pasteurella multocida]MCL7845685.1 lysozyme [Pasteurella multocida]